MSYLNFKLSKNLIIKDNPELSVIPEFARLTDRQLRYVFLVDWFKSPLRLMEIEARKVKAAILAGYKLEKTGDRLDMNGRNLVSGKVMNVEAARKELQSIQYDEEKAAFEALNNFIKETIEFLNKKEKTVNELDKANKMAKDLPNLMESRKKLAEILSFRQPLEDSYVKDYMEPDSFDISSGTSLLEDLLDEEQT